MYRLDLNPEPWAIGPLSVGRKSGGFYPQVGQNQQLRSYQEAVKEELQRLYELPVMKTGQPMKLNVWFWRNLPEYTTPQARRARKHEADLTNLLKGFEDALHGIFFDNDKDVVLGYHALVEQGPDVEGMIIFDCEPADRLDLVVIPSEVSELHDEILEDAANVWPPVE